MTFLRRSWPWLLVVLFPVLPLWRAVFLGEAIGPFDQIRQMAPWNGPAPDRPFDVLQADAVLQFYPWRDMVFEAWSRGELPLWNPYQLAGTPLLANSQSAGFYPPHILTGLVHVPTSLAMTLLAWFHLAWAGLGVMALSRRLGASKEGAAIGGLLFSGSAFMLAWTALPSVISTCAWIPWVIYGVYGVFGRGDSGKASGVGHRASGIGHRASEHDPGAQRLKPEAPSATPQRPNASTLLRPAALLAFSTGMMLLAGHLQFAAYGLFAAGFVAVALFLFGVFDRSDRPDPNLPQSSVVHRPSSVFSAVLCLLALALGAGLAAPQLLPVLEYSQFSHRRNVPTEEGYQAYVAGAIAPFELVGLVYPTAVGLPFEFAPDAQPLSQYWPALVKQGANFAEGAIGIGPLALFGLLMFPWRRAPKRLWIPLAALGVVAFLLAMGTVLNKPLYFLIPGWSSTGSPGRIGVLFVLGASVLCGVSMQRFLQHQGSRGLKEFAGDAAVVLALAMTAGLILTTVPSMSPRFQGMPDSLMATLANSGVQTFASVTVLGMLVAAILWTALTQSRKDRFRAGPGLVAATIWGAFWIPFLPRIVPTSQPLPTNALTPQRPSALSRSAFINEPWELIVAAPATMPPNTASILRIPDLAGYDSLLHKDTQLFLADINGQDSAPPANGNIQFIKPTANLLKLAEAGVNEIYSRRPLWPDIEAEALENGLLRYRLMAPGRAYVETNEAESPFTPVEDFRDGYDRQSLKASGPGTLSVKDRLMPGWKAFVNGKEIPWSNAGNWTTPDKRTVSFWRAVELPAGEHKVEFRYDPPGLRTGFLIFVPCLLLTLAGAVWGRQKRTNSGG